MGNNDPKPVVMIADGSPEQIGAIESLVSAELTGCIFVRATGIKRAIEILQTSTPNLLVLEAHFPDGEAADLLTAFPREKRQFPCLVATSDKSEDTLRSLFELGADDLLSKPIDDLIFQSKVRSLMSKQYISPLSFLGRREGLADLSFSLDLQILKLNEDRVVFVSTFPIAKTSLIELQVRQFLFKASVQASQRSEKYPGSFEVMASMEPLNELRSAEFRRLLIELNQSGTVKPNG